MGYNIGVRIIEDFLARTGSARCNDFRDTSEKVPKNSEISPSWMYHLANMFSRNDTNI